MSSPVKTVEVAAVSASSIATDDATDDEENEKRLATDSWEDHSETGTPATTPGNKLALGKFIDTGLLNPRTDHIYVLYPLQGQFFTFAMSG